MFSDNLIQLRKFNRMTQEDLADKVGVSRQAVAKWESGESIPDLDKCRILADIFGVTLDDLATYEKTDTDNLGLQNPPPKGKYIFGVVTVGEKGQIIIPAKARKKFSINPGDELVVLGDESQGIALLKSEGFLNMADMIRKEMKNHKPDNKDG